MACRLHIKICEAKKVLKMDLGGKSDPYVTLRLKSQDKKDVQKTQIISNTTDPIWNQEFDIVATDPNDVLLINMYDEDIKNDDKMMDELQFPVNTWPVGGPLDRKELDIKLKKKKAGKFIFEVQAFPAEGVAVTERSVDLQPGKKQCIVHIKAFDAKDVLKMDLGGKSDPYLRFGFKGKKESRVKTQVISNTRNPIWNQELDLPSADYDNDVLEVDMLDEDIKNDDKMMDKISIPLAEHPYGTHYTFDNDIKLKKKKAGHLHFEIDFIDPTAGAQPPVQTRDIQIEQPPQDGTAERCRVKIHAIKAENLLNMDADINSISDPFVTFQIQGQPEYAKKRTKTVDTNLNPVWDQTYELDVENRNNDVLLVNLFDEDINKDDQMMDELKFPLNQWPIGTHIDYAEDIKYKDQAAGKLYLGIDVIEPLPVQTFNERDIFIEEPANDYCNFSLGNYPSTFSTDFTGYTNWSHSLSPLNSFDLQRHHHHNEGFKPVLTRDVQLESKAEKAGESIKGKIIKANGLPKTDSDGSDTYVVLTVIPKEGKKKGEKVKTKLVHDTQDPVYDKEFEFVNAKTTDSLRAEIFQSHKVIGDQCIACVEIQLNELKENQPIEQAFTLDKPPKVPKVVKKITDFGTLTLNIVHNVNYQ